MNQNSHLEKDFERTSNFFINYVDSLINSIFSTSSKAGNIRSVFLQILFFLTWLICAFTFHQPGEIDYPWLDFLFAIPYPIVSIIVNIIELFLAWDVLLVMFSIFMGYHIAANLASIYLADIFDIKDITISERYVKQSAFSFPVYYQIHIENAQVRSEDQISPIYRIGGPGKVLINLENAVVFEKINGSPRIVGPTTEKPIELESFERIRKIIDLRDQTARLDISARTLDGISIEIKDIRLIFSVFRNSNQVSITKPYPFNEESIYWLIYQQGPGPWTTSLIDMVRTELTNYINHHLLSELLSSAGAPEINLLLQNQNKIAKKIRKNWAHTRRYKVNRVFIRKLKIGSPNHKPIYYQKTHEKNKRFSRLFINKGGNIPQLIPRTELSNLFYENLTSSFQSKAQKYGMRLEWINVGTWHSSSKIVPEQYIKAWKISSENALKLNPKVLAGIFNQNRKQNLAKNIQITPIISFIHKSENGKSNSEIVNELIHEYNAKLWSARDLYIKKKGRVPVQIERALSHIRKFQMRKLQEQAIFLGETDIPTSEMTGENQETGNTDNQ
jgi:hypothetical protein